MKPSQSEQDVANVLQRVLEADDALEFDQHDLGEYVHATRQRIKK